MPSRPFGAVILRPPTEVLCLPGPESACWRPNRHTADMSDGQDTRPGTGVRPSRTWFRPRGGESVGEGIHGDAQGLKVHRGTPGCGAPGTGESVDLQLTLVIAGLVVGVVVGLTGMGGGALMTPVLVIFFGIPPLAAVSSDLVVSAVMKPVGGLVHIRRGTVDLRLVGLLCLGSVPSAFCGVLVYRSLGNSEAVQQWTKTALGVALLVAATGLIVKAYLALVARGRRAAARARRAAGEVVPRPPMDEGDGVGTLRPVP